MSYYYSLYGLTLKSEIEFLEYQSCSSNINSYDIEILCENIVFPGEKFGNHRRIFEKDSIYLYVRSIATYRMFKGKTIYVDMDPKASLSQVKAFLTGTCMGALLYQRGSLVIHGGVVEMNNHGVIIMGDSGSGKSTLIAALREEGYGFLSDDMAVFSKEGTDIFPGYPMQRICADSISDEIKSQGGFLVDVYGKRKYVVPVKDSFKFHSIPAGIIVQLVVGDKHMEDLRYERLYGEERLRVIIENIYGISSIRLAASKMDCFKKSAEVASKIPVYKIIRPVMGITVGDEVKAIQTMVEVLKTRSAINK